MMESLMNTLVTTIIQILFLKISCYEPTDLNGRFIDGFVFFCRDGWTLFEYLQTNHGVTTVFIHLKPLVETQGFIAKIRILLHCKIIYPKNGLCLFLR